MKKTLLGAAAAFAIAAPVAAHADVAGHLDLAYQHGTVNFSDDEDVNAATLSGAVIVPMQGGWNLQFDASNEAYAWEGEDNDASAGAVSVHGIYRSDTYGLGGYASFTNIFGSTLYMVGAEGQYYMPNVTIGGAVSYGQTRSGDNEKVWDARLEGSYFFTPNFDVNGTASYTQLEEGSDTDVTGFGIGADYRFADSPFSVGANYLHESWDYGGSDNVDANVFKISLSYHFGAGSLRDQSQHGASFDTAPRIMDVFTRWD